MCTEYHIPGTSMFSHPRFEALLSLTSYVTLNYLTFLSHNLFIYEMGVMIISESF